MYAVRASRQERSEPEAGGSVEAKSFGAEKFLA